MTTKDKINKILKDIRELPEDDNKLYDLCIDLAYGFAKLSEELVKLKEEADVMVLEQIESGKSAVYAERKIATLEVGKEVFRIKMLMKSVEKILSNLKDKKKSIEHQSYNQY